MTGPANVGPGTRAAGLDMLRESMTQYSPYQIDPMGNIMKLLMGEPLVQSPSYRSEVQQGQLRNDFYSVPTGGGSGESTPEQGAFDVMRPKLGEGASGKAVQTPTDADMAMALLGRRLSLEAPGLGLAAVAQPRTLPQTLEGQNLSRGVGTPGLEAMIPLPTNPNAGHVMQNYVPNPGFPMNIFDAEGQLPFYFR